MAFVLRKEYLVSYDIENSKSRSKIYKELLKTGLKPVQKSVFWGYLTLAELKSVQRIIKELLDDSDKAFITRTSFNSNSYSFLYGHDAKEFKDWDDEYVI